jgi:outer membrane lipoprotein-sorting protein
VARAVVLLLVLVSLGAGASTAQDARPAVEAFVTRLAGVNVTDLVIVQTLTLYNPDGQHPYSTGEQRVLFKLPLRQRLEQTVEGQREVRLSVGDRVWERRADGKVYDAPGGERGSDRTRLLVPLRRSAADLLAEWKAQGVRDDVSHVVRVAGRTLTVIGARPGDRDVPSVWVDGEYGVVRFVTRERLSSGPVFLDLAFSEHRPLVGGFYFPYRQEAFVNGKLLLLITVRSIRANTNLADSLFDPEALRREP